MYFTGSFCEGGKKSKFKHKKLSTTVGKEGGGRGG
jgi:hypothetical protein